MTNRERAARELAERITYAAGRGLLVPKRRRRDGAMTCRDVAALLGMDPLDGGRLVVEAIPHLAAAGVIQIRDDELLVLLPRPMAPVDQLQIAPEVA